MLIDPFNGSNPQKLLFVQLCLLELRFLQAGRDTNVTYLQPHAELSHVSGHVPVWFGLDDARAAPKDVQLWPLTQNIIYSHNLLEAAEHLYFNISI